MEADRYVKVRKGYIGRRPRTWLSLTALGRAALSAHLSALQDLAARNARNAAAMDQ
ncbi:transcriptional regulator [Streptomyces fodineus]|uniref:transcriptional regulator n=1 Tax=Streptomyces fodineus TaxID=1904616 RepID=UPI0009A122DE|nr:transcriptional regulator [Streptomyces fodineus]